MRFSHKLRCAGGASLLALSAMISSTALAQCEPDPPTAGQTTICDGMDADGIIIASPDTSLSVSSGATLTASGTDAVLVQNGTADVYSSTVRLNVDGQITGHGYSGVRFDAGLPTYASTYLGIVVGAEGSISGSTGILLSAGADNPYASMTLNIANSGSITGTDGYAIRDTTATAYAYLRLTNHIGGTMGAISGRLTSLTNDGLIDGGQWSAIDGLIGSGYGPQANIRNQGIIRSGGVGATLTNIGAGATLTNSGTIAHLGGGTAIEGYYYSIDNQSGGVITGDILALGNDGSIQLTNAGIINGSVITRTRTNLYYAVTSTIDSRLGTINGDLLLGGGHDRLIVDYDEQGLRTGITGRIDGGSGNDTLEIRFDTDGTVNRRVALPGFEQVQITATNAANVALVDGFSSSGPLYLAGDGTISNRTTMTLNGADARIWQTGSYYGLTFRNEGTISGSIADPYANLVALGQMTFDNDGLIDVQGNALSLNYTSFTNDGEVRASDRAVFISYGNLTNRGTIRSTGGTALDTYYGSSLVNEGLIDGAGIGVLLNGALRNTGTITSPRIGVAFSSGMLMNEADGVISGGPWAIGPQDGAYAVAASTVANAGTINGNVNLATNSIYGLGNIYIALAGGILNGDLTLGSGDMLAVSLPASGEAGLAGFNGTVHSNGARLHYLVDSDASATIAPRAGFGAVSYEVAEGSTLTLNATAVQTDNLQLSGRGAVDILADFAFSNTGSIGLVERIRLPGESWQSSALTITSHGTISATRTNINYPAFGTLIGLDTDSRFINEGTLIFRNIAYPSTSSYVTAIGRGREIVNNGTILIDGAVAIGGAGKVSNSGLIADADGGINTTGIAASYLTNSGTIRVSGRAVVADYFMTNITNDGRLSSTQDVAIGGTGSLALTNGVNGVIDGNGTAIRVSHGGSITNTGLINGTVDLAYNPYGRGYDSGLFISDGGTLNGDLLFGTGNDIFLSKDPDIGVTGIIDGGDGFDIFGRTFATTGTVVLGAVPGINFEAQLIRAEGDDTILTLEASEALDNGFAIGGTGHIVNRVQTSGALTSAVFAYPYTLEQEPLASFANEANIGAFSGTTRIFSNSAVIGNANIMEAAVALGIDDRLSFANSGTIHGNGQFDLAVSIYGGAAGSLSFTNDGLIDGRVAGVFDTEQPVIATVRNSGTILTDFDSGIGFSLYSTSAGSTADIRNDGIIESSARSGSAISLSILGEQSGDYALTNNGTLRANGGGQTISYSDWGNYLYTDPAAAIGVYGDGGAVVSIDNGDAGLIEALGRKSTAILAGTAIHLDNSGEINGRAGTLLAAQDSLALALGTTWLSGAIQSIGDNDDIVTNSGSIRGDIDLGFGDDVIVNRGTIIGNVHLRDGDDSFMQLASAIMQGIVDGGAGTDTFIVDATGGGAVNADQFVNFERFFQIGEGNVAYSGNFNFDTIGLNGGTLTVAADEIVTSTGAITITGGAGNDKVINAGTIGGGIDLAGGDDSVVNSGGIDGPVSLGTGNDIFTEEAGSHVAGLIDGGAGTDLYRLILAGDRIGMGAQTGFERLAIEGNGTLTLTLGQDYEAIALTGTNLDLTTGSHLAGQISGSDAQEHVRLIGDASQMALGGGDDRLTFDLSRAAGRYDGGTGQDKLSFTAQGPVTLVGTVTGFESLSLAGGTLIVSGQLGGADDLITLGDAAERIDVTTGGRLFGTINLGAGDDAVHLADGAIWQGILSGGAGTDSLGLMLGSARTLDGGRLLDFEKVTAQGAGALTLTNGFTLQSLSVEGDLTLASGASLTTDSLTLGGADNRFTINGLFAGSIDGGAGNNRILLNGGTQDAPIRFATVGNIAGLDMAGGFATVTGAADFGAMDLAGGRLVGLAGSTIRSNSILVRSGATFGSAGTVVGDINVAGTLSPGASPGTMTVTGNVALANGSTTLMEITPTISDKLLISGTLTIAQGASLQLTADQQVRPGTTLDLIVATGGISGSYSSIIKPDTLFGFVVQDEDSIRLLGQFLNNGSFTAQVQRAIAYTNDVIAAGTASEGLIAALPQLATTSGASNAAAFARLGAEPYASATQIGVEDSLTIVNATRNIARLSSDEAPRLFGVGQYLGGLGRLGSNDQAGLSASRSRSHGLLGGLGIGTDRWSIAGFGGYLDSRQSLRTLGSQTDGNGWFAGLAGSYALGALHADATLGYYQAKADTDRLTPDGGKAHGRFRLKNWIGDLSLSYEARLGTGWAVQPDIGLTYIATTRTGLSENGGTVWALDVMRDKHEALFADSGFTFGRSRDSQAALRPFIRLGVRYQLQGRGVDALAGFAGSSPDLLSLGTRRAGLVGNVSGGAEMRVSPAFSIYANASQSYSQNDRRASANVGLRFNF